MEQEALLLLLLDKVRKLEQQVQEQAPLFTWARRLVPRLWFENIHGQDALLVAENTQGRSAIAKDTYWNQIMGRWIDPNRKITLVVSGTELCVQSVPNIGNSFTLCKSYIRAGQARLWHYVLGTYTYPLLYPLSCKAQVDKMLLEAAKRFGWEVREK